MSFRPLFCLAVILAGCSSPKQTSKPGSPAQLLPAGWDAKAEADKVMAGLIKTTAPEVKGAHDAHLAIVGDRAFVISEVNERQPSENASWSFIYSSVSIIDLRTRQVLDVLTVARSEQAFTNETLPVGSCFVPRIKQVGPQTLRCWFASEQPGKRQSQTYFRDLDLRTLTFEKEIHRMKLQTSDGRSTCSRNTSMPMPLSKASNANQSMRAFTFSITSRNSTGRLTSPLTTTSALRRLSAR
ncbi:MAG: hypothetical protein EBQ59_09805 [Verrucomicrobia bacterium]|nr:hypothetical protein [Verrucomicrobiota bacterium]